MHYLFLNLWVYRLRAFLIGNIFALNSLLLHGNRKVFKKLSNLIRLPKYDLAQVLIYFVWLYRDGRWYAVRFSLPLPFAILSLLLLFRQQQPFSIAICAHTFTIVLRRFRHRRKPFGIKKTYVAANENIVGSGLGNKSCPSMSRFRNTMSSSLSSLLTDWFIGSI